MVSTEPSLHMVVEGEDEFREEYAYYIFHVPSDPIYVCRVTTRMEHTFNNFLGFEEVVFLFPAGWPESREIAGF
ncbi:hypothetical protein IGI04_008293 [Brassica rapa subsp. trilocularis]|uniref:Uncharacterized protein n=1 Tax=Brassica rapa subsp. trilocularis TaxID=1813537 RepID=A0ABQ7NQG3_BRACM|nr:hypothetical protein IGI04_008293 [Brassica rapa subsp. trilocularis]